MPQGGPLSPLLQNLVLDEFDRELTRRGLRFCRYADDCNIYVGSRRAGERIMASVCRFLTTRASAQGQRIEECGGPKWGAKVPGIHDLERREPTRQIAAKALQKFKDANPGTDVSDARCQSTAAHRAWRDT